MTDTPDLHTLAAEAPDPAAIERLMIETFWRFHLPEPEKTDGVTWLRINAALRAGLGAVLPAHRRQVLAEAARHYGEMARGYAEMASDREWLTAWLAAHGLSTTPGPGPVIQAVARDLQDVVRRLASAAAETAPTPRHSDETAPAVPEATPGPGEGAVVIEHAQLMSGGGMHVRPNDPEIERIFPLEQWITAGQRGGGRVFRRTVIVVDDWTEVTAPQGADEGNDRG